VPPEQIDCVFVPGLAFDRHGGRLGFGGGYYDRFLCHISPLASVCGLAFGIQVVPCVPQMPHDIRMHVLVTEQGPIPCTPAPPGQAANDCRGRA
jgi:5-formyltetrahydrofolate cyclo-ligase